MTCPNLRRLVPILCLCFFVACGGQGADSPEADEPSPDMAPDVGIVEDAGGDVSDEDDGGMDGPANPIETLQIEAGAFVFDARAAGPADGEVVLLLHGFPQTSFEWRAQLLALGEAGYRAIAPNQRGYSATARPPEIDDYEVSKLVGDVVAMADALDADRFHVVGHDWGAIVAWATAAAVPERVETLSVVSIPHPDAFAAELADTESCQYQASSYFDLFSQEGIESFFLANDAAQLRNIYAGLSEEAIADYVAVLGSPEALGAALNWYRANIVERMIQSPPLGPVTVPTLFMWSDMDDAVCKEGADKTGDFVTGPYRYEIIEGVSHWVPELAPDAVSTLLLEHLSD